MTSPPILRQVQEVFARSRPIDADANFFEAGWTSQTLASVLGGLQERGLTVKLVDLYRFPTVRALATELGRRADPDVRSEPRGVPWA